MPHFCFFVFSTNSSSSYNNKNIFNNINNNQGGFVGDSHETVDTSETISTIHHEPWYTKCLDDGNRQYKSKKADPQLLDCCAALYTEECITQYCNNNTNINDKDCKYRAFCPLNKNYTVKMCDNLPLNMSSWLIHNWWMWLVMASVIVAMAIFFAIICVFCTKFGDNQQHHRKKKDSVHRSSHEYGGGHNNRGSSKHKKYFATGGGSTQKIRATGGGGSKRTAIRKRTSIKTSKGVSKRIIPKKVTSGPSIIPPPPRRKSWKSGKKLSIGRSQRISRSAMIKAVG